MRELLRHAFYGAAPRAFVGAYLDLRLRREARRLVSLRDAAAGEHALVDELLASQFFRPLQKRSEVLRLLEVVRGLRPARVCEIGAAGGGTAFLFTHAAAADALVVSVDLEFSAARREAVRGFAQRGQRVVCVRGDSHSEAMLAGVRAHLGGRGLDLLYLDGDHSYEGVETDFRLYAPLVRAGGLVVFHDIVPDYWTRYGTRTKSDTGGVPRFWRELKEAGASVEEIVEDEGQDGFGIGVLSRDGAAFERALSSCAARAGACV